MPRFGNKKISLIIRSANELNIFFLVMSHDGNKNYDGREYKHETIIQIEDFIDSSNEMPHSFIQYKLENSALYKKYVS
jgi:hypothetical protein